MQAYIVKNRAGYSYLMILDHHDENKINDLKKTGNEVERLRKMASSNNDFHLPSQIHNRVIETDVLGPLLDDLEDRYDGAPDSETKWMGGHIINLGRMLSSRR